MDVVGEIIVEAVVLALDTLVIGFCLKELSKCKHVINALQTAPVLDIDSTLNREISKYPNNIIPYVVIRGIVKPLGNPITSTTNPSVTGVVQRLTIKEHVIQRTSAGFWSDQENIVAEVLNSCPFVLSNGKYSIEVLDAVAAEILEMDVISDKFEPMPSGVMQHMWGWFWGMKQRGVQSMEEILRDGSYITAVGELSSTGSGLKLQPPRDGLPLYLTTRTKTSLLKKLTTAKDHIKVLLVLSGAVATLVSCRLVYKMITRKRRKEQTENMKRQLAEGRKERRAQNRDRNLGESQLCVVCVENPKEIILLPCGHVCLCEDCSDHITDKCPICRKDIESRSPAFIS